VMDGSDLDSDTGQARVIDALQSGVGCIQLRDKRSDTQTLIKRTQTLMRLARPWRVLVIVNDRVA
jgi:thiamine monophosphate synthase